MIQSTATHKKYIGITSQTLEERFRQHKYGRNSKKRRICMAIKKYGADTFSISEIDTVDSMEEALKLETKYVKKYNTFNDGYNGNEGGYGPLVNPMLGRRHTEESKRKMSISKKGKQPRLNAILSEETKKRIGLANSGNRAWNKGLLTSETTKRRISESKKGKISHTKTYEITFPNGDVVVINNMAKFCREHGIGNSNMSSVAKGRLKQYRGFRCKEVITTEI